MANGYTVLNDKRGHPRPEEASKIQSLLHQPGVQDAKAMPYAIDRTDKG